MKIDTGIQIVSWNRVSSLEWAAVILLVPLIESASLNSVLTLLGLAISRARTHLTMIGCTTTFNTLKHHFRHSRIFARLMHRKVSLIVIIVSLMLSKLLSIKHDLSYKVLIKIHNLKDS